MVGTGSYENESPDADWVEVRWKRLLRAYDKADRALCIVITREILEGAPDFYPAMTVLGKTLTELALYEEAESVLLKALELSPPKYRRGHLKDLGHHYRDRGLPDLAEEWYRKSIEDSPDHASGYIYLGALLVEQGRFDEASDAHQRATNCSEGDIAEAHHNLGLIHRARGRYEDATECFRRALRLDPEYHPAKKALLDVQRTMIYLRRLR